MVCSPLPSTRRKADESISCAIVSGKSRCISSSATTRLYLVPSRRPCLPHPLAKNAPIDLGAVANFLAFEYLPGSQSLRQGLRKLPPGHLLTYFQGRSEIQCY